MSYFDELRDKAKGLLGGEEGIGIFVTVILAIISIVFIMWYFLPQLNGKSHFVTPGEQAVGYALITLAFLGLIGAITYWALVGSRKGAVADINTTAAASQF